jgi:hypothetical protein
MTAEQIALFNTLFWAWGSISLLLGILIGLMIGLCIR